MDRLFIFNQFKQAITEARLFRNINSIFMKNFFYFSLLSLTVLAGCRADRHAARIFDRAETLMSEAPDSALLLLRDIAPATLDSKSLRARHALLYSQALDKNGIDLKEDTIIAPAVAYYAHHGSRRDKAYTNYYLGRIRHNAGRVGEAALLMLEAEKYARPTGETNLLGLIYNCRGNLYYSQYSLDEALEMYTKADSCFRQLGKIVFAGYMIQAKAKTYALQKNDSASLREFHRALTIFDSIANHAQVCTIASSIAYLMKSQDKTNIKSIKKFLLDIYKKHTHNIIPTEDYPMWSEIYLHENNIDSAKLFCSLTLNTSQTTNQQCGFLPLLGQVAAKQGDYKKANKYWQDAYFLIDSISYAEKKHLIQRIEERYENKELQLRNEMLHLKNSYIIIIGQLSLVILLGIFTTLYRRWRRALRQRAEELANSQHLIEELFEYQAALKTECEEMHIKLNDGSRQATHLMDLFEQRLQSIQQLLADAYSSICTTKQLHKKCKEFASKMNMSASATSDLRDLVEMRYKGVLAHLHVHHPKLTNSDINLLAMTLLGFSPNCIRLVFKHENQDSLNSRRTKIRTRIGLPAHSGLDNYLFHIANQLKNGETPDTPQEYVEKI